MDNDTLAPIAREIFADLCSRLPKSADDTEEAIATRARRALDAVLSLHPEDAFEALLATRIVAMDAHCADALRGAAQAAGDADKVRSCRAQAASMARQSDSALRTLLRRQAERDKAYNAGHPAAMERAGYWFKEVVVPEQSAAPAVAEPEPVRTRQDVEADAKLYAVMYPDRVRRIRAAGGLPPDLDFGPPEADIVAALLRGHVSGRATKSNGSGH